MPRTEVFALSGVITFAIQVSGFLVAYLLQTEVFYDILGGLNFLILSVSTFWFSSSRTSSSSDNWLSRKVVSTTLFFCSRSWLLLFLAWRAHDRKGDSRFDNVKNNFGLFFVYWMVQAMWVFIISMPMIFINSSGSSCSQDIGDDHQVLSVNDWIFAAGFAFGIVIEIVADVQKAVWVSNKRQGGFCSVGIWKYSRHPNYFGEILQWWCSWLLAYESCCKNSSKNELLIWLACAASPMFTMNLLLNLGGTGIAQAEGKNLKRYYENKDCAERYAEYHQNTSILIPMVGYRFIPLWMKRTLLFDFERYQYKASTSSTPNNNIKND